MSGKNAFMIVGHRGLQERHEENSLESFSWAKAAGLDAVELDVQFSKDGEIIVFHDYDMDRLCGVRGSPWDYMLAEMKTFRIGKKRETIPTIVEVMDAMGDFPIFIELKTVDDEGGLVNYGIEEPLARIITGRESSRYRFLSFNPLSLRRLKELSPEFIVGLNLSPETIRYYGEIDMDMIRRFSVDFVQPEVSMYLEGGISGIENKGMEIIPWTVNTVDEAKACMERGASGVISDIPLKLKDLIWGE
ncbi:MAG: glycerophosphodiester phosphodiesterase [Thermoplasmataceae archaeon]